MLEGKGAALNRGCLGPLGHGERLLLVGDDQCVQSHRALVLGIDNDGIDVHHP